MEHVSVSVGESTSFNVLSRKSDVVSLVNQGRESKSFSSAPVNSFSFIDCCMTGLENLDDLWVEFGIGRQISDLVSNFMEFFQVDTSVFQLTVTQRVPDLGPLVVDPVLRFELQVLALLIGGLELILSVLVDFS